mmetsp:Transcript_78503/g.227859  ORF Transcript_78503/g.227859 Transcript_78503/m.227859 type:complete len:240 (-) Transcript_78503:89-808(-)
MSWSPPPTARLRPALQHCSEPKSVPRFLSANGRLEPSPHGAPSRGDAIDTGGPGAASGGLSALRRWPLPLSSTPLSETQKSCRKPASACVTANADSRRKPANRCKASATNRSSNAVHAASTSAAGPEAPPRPRHGARSCAVASRTQRSTAPRSRCIAASEGTRPAAASARAPAKGPSDPNSRRCNSPRQAAPGLSGRIQPMGSRSGSGSGSSAPTSRSWTMAPRTHCSTARRSWRRSWS